ncbi:MAG: hypothetical protein WC319_15090 [Candidatus Paceibacterota bacterium]|jgi:hypothetical protein
MTKVSKKQKVSESTEPAIVGYTVLYAVLKLSQDITYTDPFTREERKEKIQGIAGFIPCYETYEEAEEAACDGKFQIMPIKPA